MKAEKINELVTNFSNKESIPEVLDAKVKIDGVEISVLDLMKSSYKRGLEINFENDVSELYKFSYRPKFDSDSILGSYYIVVHHFADKPELCHYDGKVLTNQEGIQICEKEVIGAIKVDIPNEAIKALDDWRERNFSKTVLNEIVNHIVFHTYDREEAEYSEYLRLKRKYEGFNEEV